MTQAERVEAHGVFAALTKLQLATDLISGSRMTEEVFDHAERARRANQHALAVIKASDPYLVPLVVLNDIESSATAASSEFGAFSDNGNTGHLTNASAHLDSLLVHVTKLPPPGPTEVAEGMRETLTSFRRSAGQLMSSLERDQVEATSKASALDVALSRAIQELEAQKGRIDTAISEYQNQFSQGENSRRDEFQRVIQEHATRTNEALDKQNERIQDTITSAERNFQNGQLEMMRLVTEIQREGKSRADAVVIELEEIRSKAQELMHVIGNTGMAGEFQKVALGARNRTFFWQTATVISILGLIGFAVWAFYSTTSGEFRWEIVGTRAFVALTFGVLAAFSSRQADRGHSAELHNRRYQLELSAIDPYLISLPEAMRHEVKVRLADKLFGAPAPVLGNKDKAPSGTSLDVIKAALETIQEMAKRG